MSTPPTEREYVLGFRPDDDLLYRLDQAIPIAAPLMELPIGRVRNQALIPWLLNRALDQLGVPRKPGKVR